MTNHEPLTDNKCQHCGKPVAQIPGKPKRRYCSALCRQASYRQRATLRNTEPLQPSDTPTQTTPPLRNNHTQADTLAHALGVETGDLVNGLRRFLLAQGKGGERALLALLDTISPDQPEPANAQPTAPHSHTPLRNGGHPQTTDTETQIPTPPLTKRVNVSAALPRSSPLTHPWGRCDTLQDSRHRCGRSISLARTHDLQTLHRQGPRPGAALLSLCAPTCHPLGRAGYLRELPPPARANHPGHQASDRLGSRTLPQDPSRYVTHPPTATQWQGFPHIRGDGPFTTKLDSAIPTFSPHTWGWTALSEGQVASSPRFPHIRGDGPD